MQKAIAQSFIDLIARRTAPVVATNADVYDQKLLLSTNGYHREPYFIYFYYIKFGVDGCVEISHYEWLNPTPIPHNQLQAHVERLARNARDPHGVTPPKSGARFENIVWERISYIVILMDSPSWTLLKRTPTQSCLAFNLTKKATPNCSFFDAADLNVDVAEQGHPPIMRTAVYFVNHMKKDSNGTELRYKPDGVTRDTQDFAFDVVFAVKDCNGNDSSPFIIDPDGTNMGPPLGPP